MATTYSAYYNLNADASAHSSRRTSGVNASKRSSVSEKMDKISDFLAPRWPMYPPLGPSAHASQDSSRRTSGVNTSSKRSSLSEKMDKISDALAPRWPIYPPLNPTAHKKTSSVAAVEPSSTQGPVRMYDSVLRRPLFSKARKGNEVTITERRMSADSQ